MSYRTRELERQVFSYCPETCPDVEAAFADTFTDVKGIVGANNHDELERLLDALLKRVKEVGTEKLREALRQAVEDKNEAKGERDQANDRISDLEDDIRGLERELAEHQS